MPHYYVVPLVESRITVWHPRQRRLIRLRQPLGVDQSEAQTLILGHSGLALVATVDPLHDARATKFAEHRDERMSGAARTALARIAGDREMASGRRCGDAIADLLKTPPAEWNMRPLRPSRARTLLTPGYYVWLDPTERTPVYFEPVAQRAHSKGWRDHFDAPDGPLNGRTPPEGVGGASWLAGSLVTIASNQARVTLTSVNTGDVAELVAGALPALTDSDDAYVSADFVSVVAGGSNALILYGWDLPNVFVGGLEAGWWGHAGNVFGMWSYATSAAVATSGSTTFTAGTYRIWRSGSSVGLQLWTGSAWVDVLGPVTNTADQGDSCFAGFAAFAHAGSGVFTLDDFTFADDDYSFAPASVTITSVTPDELSDGLTGVVIAGENFSDSGNAVWLTTTPDPQGRPAIDSRGDPLAVTNGTSNALDVPAHEAGDLLIAVASHDTSGALAISGWTAITSANNGTACRLAVFALLATGNSHTATLTGSNNDTVAQVFRIAKGHHAVTDVSTDIRVGTAATGNNAAPNPPSVGSLTATVPYLVLAIAGSDDDDDTPSYAPSGYTPELQQESASSTSSCLLQIASLQALGITSVDPGTFSLAASEEWVAQTIVIPGHAAVAQTITAEDEDEIVITVDHGDLPLGTGFLHVLTADNVWSNAAAVTLVEAGEPERLSARSATATRSAVALASRAALAAASRTVTSTVVAVSVAAQIAAASSTPTRTDVALTSEAVRLSARSATATRTAADLGIEPAALAVRSSTATRTTVALTSEDTAALSARSATPTRTAVALAVESVALASRSASPTRTAVAASARVSLSSASMTSTRTVAGLTAATVTLPVRSATATRSGVRLSSVGGMAVRTQTPTRTAIALAVPAVSLSARSATSTRTAVALRVSRGVAVQSATSTRTAVDLAVAPVALSARSVTTTRTAAVLAEVARLPVSSRTLTRSTAALAVPAVTLHARSGTPTRSTVALTVIAIHIPVDQMTHIRVPAEDRTISIVAEDRTISIVAEDRTIRIPARSPA